MRCEIAKPSDANDVISLLATVFSESEPPAVAMGLTSREMEHFLSLFAPRETAGELTVIARCPDTGKLAGALLTDDLGKPAPLDLSIISPKLLPILSMLEALDGQFRRANTILPGQYLHLFMLGVDRGFTGRGIAQEMVAACLANGVRKGYRGAMTEATGEISQRVFRKQGFAERYSVAYRDFKYEGKAVFASIEKHERAILMEKSFLSAR